MEGKAYQICLDSLGFLKKAFFYEYFLLDQVEMMKLELRFLRMFMLGLECWEDLEYDWRLRFAINTMMPKFNQLAKKFEVDLRSRLNFEVIFHDLEKALQQFKPHIKDICINLLGGASMCTSTPSTCKKILRYERDTASLFYLIQHNLEALQKSDLMAPVMKKQIALMQQGMEDYGMLVGPPPNRLFNLVPRTLAWFNRISCLTCVFWIDGNDESVTSTMEALLSGLLHKTRPCNSSRVISLYFQHSEIYQPLASYLDFLLEDLALPMKCYIDILQEDVIFMLSFLMDPPNVDSEDGELVWAQIYATVNKFPSFIHSGSFDVINEEVCKAKLLDFLMKVNELKAKVRDHSVIVIPYSSQNPSPTTNVSGFLNILVLNLRRMLKEELHLIPSLKHLCESLLNELEIIGPLLKNMMELLRDGEHREILNLWSRIGNMVYNADYCSKLCFLRTERLKLLATEYLKDLVSQGLVIVTKRGSKGGIKRCNVHDLLYDLCLEKAKEDNFLHWAEESVVDRLLKYNLHRLRVGESDPFIESSHTVTNRELPTSPLHSFLWSNYDSSAGREFSNRLLVNFKLLTVLKLSLRVDEFPEAILSQAICLRYLELFIRGNVTAIPPTIANLRTLITLIIVCYGLKNGLLPSSMWDMESLRHVDIGLARLDLEGFDPKNSSMSNIETLGSIYLDEDDSTTVDFLRRFPNLRKLKCRAGKREWHIMELLSMVGSILIQLESLEFRGEGNLEGHPKSIVREFAKNENLTKLSLYSTKIPWSVLSEIGKQLPNLLVLKLLYDSCEGRSWKLEDGDFSNLIYLKLCWLDIEEFDISRCDDPLPCLEHLVLKYCRSLVEIPPVLGEINTLKTIRVYECSEELRTSAMTILEEQREFGNETLQVIVEDDDY